MARRSTNEYSYDVDASSAAPETYNANFLFEEEPSDYAGFSKAVGSLTTK